MTFQQRMNDQRNVTLLRTHTSGELRLEHNDQVVTLCGWVNAQRDHGGLVFIDLRDRYGMTQVVFDPDNGAEMLTLARSLRNEDVIQVTGKVVPRGEKLVNPKLLTGQIEIVVSQLTILNRCKTPPFLPGSTEVANEEIRLKHRFLDLRRPALQEAMIFRHKLSKLVRDYFDKVLKDAGAPGFDQRFGKGIADGGFLLAAILSDLTGA